MPKSDEVVAALDALREALAGSEEPSMDDRLRERLQAANDRQAARCAALTNRGDDR